MEILRKETTLGDVDNVMTGVVRNFLDESSEALPS